MHSNNHSHNYEWISNNYNVQLQVIQHQSRMKTIK